MFVADAKQLKAYDAALVAGGYSMETLVDMASACLVPHCQGYEQVAIFCGNGNNGSDGLSLAVKLQALGKQVQVVLVSDSQRRGVLNGMLCTRLDGCGIPVLDMDSVVLSAQTLVVDAMLGFGFTAVPRANTLRAIQIINRHPGAVLSVDIPSGLHCDGFQPGAPMVRASKTVCFVAVKQGFLNAQSHGYLGELVVAPLPVTAPEITPPLAVLYGDAMAGETLKTRDYATYKGKQGHSLLLTGSRQYLGAGLLSTKACVYSGCGLNSWWGPSELAQTMVANTPELIAQWAEDGRPNVAGKTAILVGSGLGLSDQSEAFVAWAVEETTLPLVIDGDGLTILARRPDLLALVGGRAIFTPHAGEFARFAPQGDTEVERAYEFARRHGIVLVHKGPNTLVTDGQTLYRATTGNRRMATAGMGDVLAGLITGLLAAGYTLLEAANLGVHLHGAAGDMVAKTHYTAVPSLVIEAIPQVMHGVEVSKSV